MIPKSKHYKLTDNRIVIDEGSASDMRRKMKRLKKETGKKTYRIHNAPGSKIGDTLN